MSVRQPGREWSAVLHPLLEGGGLCCSPFGGEGAGPLSHVMRPRLRGRVLRIVFIVFLFFERIRASLPRGRLGVLVGRLAASTLNFLASVAPRIVWDRDPFIRQIEALTGPQR